MPGPTNMIMLRIADSEMELPFDELYTAFITLSNQYNAQRVNMSIRLSKTLMLL